jgi:hypothetical protein
LKSNNPGPLEYDLPKGVAVLLTRPHLLRNKPTTFPDDFLVLLDGKPILTWPQDAPPKDEKVNWASYRKGDRTLFYNANGKNPGPLGRFEYGRQPANGYVQVGARVYGHAPRRNRDGSVQEFGRLEAAVGEDERRLPFAPAAIRAYLGDELVFQQVLGGKKPGVSWVSAAADPPVHWP